MSLRETYVVTVRGPEGPMTVEDVRSGRTESVTTSAEAAEQIDRWRDERSEPDSKGTR